MPGCAAVGCSNSSEKGYTVKRFPKHPKRRKEWAIRTKRDNWFPTDCSVLCEEHFEPEMWETTREDGSRRLRGIAIPTIFFIKNKPKRIRIKRDILMNVSKNLLNNAVPSTPLEDKSINFSEIIIDGTLPPTSSEDTEVGLVPENISTNEGVVLAENLAIEHSYASLTSASIETSILRSSKLTSDSSTSEDPRPVLQTLSEKEKLTLYEKTFKKKEFLLRKYKNKFKCAVAKIKNLEGKLKHIVGSTKRDEAMILNKL